MRKNILVTVVFISLIHGCSSGGSSSPEGSSSVTQTVNNVLLSGDWKTECFPTGGGTSFDQLTTFLSDTTAVQFNTSYSDELCSVQAISMVTQVDFTYSLGAEVAIDNTNNTITNLTTATEIDLVQGGNTIYSIIAVDNLVTLYFGNTVNTITDGTTSEKRAVGLALNVPFIKE